MVEAARRALSWQGRGARRCGGSASVQAYRCWVTAMWVVSTVANSAPSTKMALSAFRISICGCRQAAAETAVGGRPQPWPPPPWPALEASLVRGGPSAPLPPPHVARPAVRRVVNGQGVLPSPGSLDGVGRGPVLQAERLDAAVLHRGAERVDSGLQQGTAGQEAGSVGGFDSIFIGRVGQRNAARAFFWYMSAALPSSGAAEPRRTAHSGRRSIGRGRSISIQVAPLRTILWTGDGKGVAVQSTQAWRRRQRRQLACTSRRQPCGALRPPEGEAHAVARLEHGGGVAARVDKRVTISAVEPLKWRRLQTGGCAHLAGSTAAAASAGLTGRHRWSRAWQRRRPGRPGCPSAPTPPRRAPQHTWRRLLGRS